jgi:hypothetical protein
MSARAGLIKQVYVREKRNAKEDRYMWEAR